jgi:hypothetical protein
MLQSYLHAYGHKTISYSYPRVAVIWIDVHPAVETWSTRHIRHSYASCGQSPYMTTINANPVELDGSYYSQEKKAHAPIHIRRLTDLWVHTQFLSHNNHWGSRLKPIIRWWIYYIDLLDLYHQYAISMFNTCS